MPLPVCLGLISSPIMSSVSFHPSALLHLLLKEELMDHYIPLSAQVPTNSTSVAEAEVFACSGSRVRTDSCELGNVHHAVIISQWLDVNMSGPRLTDH